MMAKLTEIDYECESLILKRKANFYAQKIWGLRFNGNVEFSKGQKSVAGIIYSKKPLIRFKKELVDQRLEYCVDDLLIYFLTKWYCFTKELNKDKDFQKELDLHGICSKDEFFIQNGKAYTGTITRRLWDPTIKLIDLNLEFSEKG